MHVWTVHTYSEDLLHYKVCNGENMIPREMNIHKLLYNNIIVYSLKSSFSFLLQASLILHHHQWFNFNFEDVDAVFTPKDVAMTTLNYSLPHLPHFVPQVDNANHIDEDPNSLSEATSKALLSNEHSQLSIHTVGQKLKK